MRPTRWTMTNGSVIEIDSDDTVWLRNAASDYSDRVIVHMADDDRTLTSIHELIDALMAVNDTLEMDLPASVAEKVLCDNAG